MTPETMVWFGLSHLVLLGLLFWSRRLTLKAEALARDAIAHVHYLERCQDCFEVLAAQRLDDATWSLVVDLQRKSRTKDVRAAIVDMVDDLKVLEALRAERERVRASNAPRFLKETAEEALTAEIEKRSKDKE